MWIIDITSQLNLTMKNYYCFNPSIIHYKDNIYIVVYRIAHYDIPMEYHPWKIWDSGYKFFDNPKNVIQNKYRNELGNEHTVLISGKNQITKTAEHDSTGLAFFSFNGNRFDLITNINNIFGNEMNQDARIIKIGDDFYVTYNVFERYDKTCVRMRYRKLKITGTNIKLSAEYPMFSPRYKDIDKNCVFDLNKNILYEIGRTFDIIIDGKMIRKKVPELAKLIDYYGDSNIFVSIGSPPVKFGDCMLATGHIKITYKSLMNKHPVDKFLKTINFADIHKHGKYIYFIFIYVFDKNYNIVKISEPFIPTLRMNHLPYLLAFPTGLCWLNGKICISYGEGDIKCKFLVLNNTELCNLLGKKMSMGFYFLTNHYNILHYGYFNNLNCGDDAFRLVFKYLQQQYYPHFSIDFSSQYDCKYDLCIVGGGDVVNNYFINPILKKLPAGTTHVPNLIAAGVGIPYTSGEQYLKLFDNIILRNPRDYSRLKNSHKKISYYPDMTFLLKKIIKTPCYIRTGRKIGLCLTRTYHNPKYPNLYNAFVTEIVKFIRLMIADRYSIHLIPFCINHKKEGTNENDLLLYADILKHFKSTSSVVLEFDNSYNRETYVEKTFNKIAEMDFNVCTRFHSHIFSTIHKIPFVSLTCGRKCIEYMRDIESTDNMYEIRTNEIDLPVDFNGSKFYGFLKTKILDKENIRARLTHRMEIYDALMINFEKKWKKMIYWYLYGTETVQLFPNISKKYDNFFDKSIDSCSPPTALPVGTRLPMKGGSGNNPDLPILPNLPMVGGTGNKSSGPDSKPNTTKSIVVNNKSNNVIYVDKTTRSKEKYFDIELNAGSNIESNIGSNTSYQQNLKMNSSHNISQPLYIQQPIETQQSMVIKQTQPVVMQQTQPVVIKQSQPVVVQQVQPIAVQQIQPTYIQQTQPVTVQQVQPTVVQQIQPTYVQQPQPVVVQQTQPVVVQQTQPIYVQRTQPSYDQQTQPVAVQQTQPTYVQQYQPTYIQQSQPTYVQQPQPAYVQQPQPTYVQQPQSIYVQQSEQPIYVQQSEQPIYTQQSNQLNNPVMLRYYDNDNYTNSRFYYENAGDNLLSDPVDNYEPYKMTGGTGPYIQPDIIPCDYPLTCPVDFTLDTTSPKTSYPDIL